MLDMGSGGREVLVVIFEDADGEAPPCITASEGFEPNLPIAHSALEPFGAKVLGFADDAHSGSMGFSRSPGSARCQREGEYGHGQAQAEVQPIVRTVHRYKVCS